MIHVGSISSSAVELKNTAAARLRIRQRAEAAQALTSTCLRVGTRRRWTSASEGRLVVWGAFAPSVRARVLPGGP